MDIAAWVEQDGCHSWFSGLWLQPTYRMGWMPVNVSVGGLYLPGQDALGVDENCIRSRECVEVTRVQQDGRHTWSPGPGLQSGHRCG